MSKCLICRGSADIHVSYDYMPDARTHQTWQVACPRCGDFRIRHWLATKLLETGALTPREAANASGYLRENPGYFIKTDPDLKFLRDLRQPSVIERAMKLMRHCTKLRPKLGDWLDFQTYRESAERGEPGFRHDDLLAVTWSSDRQEIDFLSQSVLRDTLGYLDEKNFITAKGWAALEEQATTADPTLVFVAMWFHDDLRPVYTGAIHPAIQEAGYYPERLDFEEHTDPIDDKMMADIRRCHFLVADLTAHRNNVYFEAGFALGLGKRVIWLIREDEMDKKGFDVRQYNFIDWSPNDLPRLQERLKLRIQGSIGQGPVAVPR